MPEHETDKPPGTGKHPPNVAPERQGPGTRAEDEPHPAAPPPASGEPDPEGSPGEPGVTTPRR